MKTRVRKQQSMLQEIVAQTKKNGEWYENSQFISILKSQLNDYKGLY